LTPPFALPDPAGYARVVAAAFAQRRKTLRNSLAGLLDAGRIAAAGVDPQLRPETLPPQSFAALAAQLHEPGTEGNADWSPSALDL
jgi:16S rRNA (adenine1518-N6/adenine1519-N6)-dimethyltransferase